MKEENYNKYLKDVQDRTEETFYIWSFRIEVLTPQVSSTRNQMYISPIINLQVFNIRFQQTLVISYKTISVEYVLKRKDKLNISPREYSMLYE